MTTAVYCNRHDIVEHFTGREAEDLINGLAADLSDTRLEPEPPDPDALEALREWCPLETLRLYRDGEMYAEHLEGQREARLNVGGER